MIGIQTQPSLPPPPEASPTATAEPMAAAAATAAAESATTTHKAGPGKWPVVQATASGADIVIFSII
jgi:hypothetical protein